MKDVLIVGAGLSGSVLARELAEAGIFVHVIEGRGYVGGNCHTARDPGTGILAHVHGPHIFHTNCEEVWRYIQLFGEWVPFINRVKAHSGEGIFSLPINLHTINQFFKRTLDPRDASAFLATRAETGIRTPTNFEEQALKFIGRELYETFFRDYTIKQWGCHPTDLPPEILKRLPVRFNYNDGYYDCPYQAIPREGYTRVVENILAHPRVKVSLDTPWDPAMRPEVSHVFFSGALDQFYGFCDGRLGYRTVHWQQEIHDGDFQGNAVINYTRLDPRWTRVIEHKHFAPWESHARTLVSREFSKETGAGDTPHYPKRLGTDLAILERYVSRPQGESGLSFLGRLGTYRYLDMDKVVDETLTFARTWLSARSAGGPLPVFPCPPL